MQGDLGTNQLNIRDALLEREAALEASSTALEETESSRTGGSILIEGPAGVGKTALLGALEQEARGRGFEVLHARGSEMERDFGFGVVRQLLTGRLRSLSDDGRAKLLSGPAALAAPIFGLADTGALEVSAAEGSLYGLFWLIAGLAEMRMLVLAIDDAHWSDAASLRFVRYLGQRLDDLPVLIALAARPNEPGAQAEQLRGLLADIDPPAIRPAPLSQGASAEVIRARTGTNDPAVESACHVATGGNPFLLEELLTELDSAAASNGAPLPERIAAMGPERIAAGVIERAGRLDPSGPDVVRAVAVLGDGADLRAVAALAELDDDRAAGIVDGLAAASILADRPRHRFAHPLQRTAVYEEIPTATRALAHARAARLLVDQGAEPEEIAAHLLLCEPGSVEGALEVLDAAAAQAAERGAPDSAAAYLRRALEERGANGDRGERLHRLGRAEVALREPASIAHLQEAAELTTDPERGLEISMELIELFGIAGMWNETSQLIDATMQRFESSDLPHMLELEAFRASMRGYDPARIGEYEAELPGLLEAVRGRTDEETALLRWVIAGLGSIQDMPTELVIELVGPTDRPWSLARGGRDNAIVAQGAFGLIVADALEQADHIPAALVDDARVRGSLMAMIASTGLAASIAARRGQLGPAEASLKAGMELLQTNEISLMALTTYLYFCLDTIVERHGLDPIADLVEGLEVPPPFGETHSGAMAHEVRAAVRTARGDRQGALEDLRAAEPIYRPLRVGPRFSSWRSRLALALDEEQREEAFDLVEEELELATALESARGEGVALRTLGLLNGGEGGVELLRESVAKLRQSPSELELARSLTELGAALRRGNQRNEAREQLREAADLAQRCGAELLEERVREELRVAGAKPRRRAISGVEALTPSELRVAEAAAGGETNKEIAQRLFVSLRTVEMHLTNSYRKLGISSRGQLSTTISD